MGGIGRYIDSLFGGRAEALGGVSRMARCRKSAKFERCVQHVKAQNVKRRRQRKRTYNPWAVCTVSVCKGGSR